MTLVNIDAETITDDQIRSVRGCGIPLGIYVLALTPQSTAWIDGAIMTTREARDYCARIYRCPHCTEEPRRHGPTCGRSECQEASYRECVQRARRGRRKKAPS